MTNQYPGNHQWGPQGQPRAQFPQPGPGPQQPSGMHGPQQHQGPQRPGHQQLPQQPGQQRPLTDLADGEWHRLHPLSAVRTNVQFTFGMFWFVIIMLASSMVSHDDDVRGQITLVLAIVLAVIWLPAVILVWLHVRSHRFRVDHEVFELRKGIITRQYRRIRLDRLQSINLKRSIGARLFGLTSLEFNDGGGDSDGAISLDCIGRDEAERLRAEILRRASGARRLAANARSANRMEGSSASATGQPQTIGQPHAPGQPHANTQQHASQAPKRVQSSSLGDYINGVLDDLTNFDDLFDQDPELVRVRPWRVGMANAMAWLLPFVFLTVALIVFFVVFSTAMHEDNVPEFVPIMGGFMIFGWVLMLVFPMVAVGVTSALGSLNYTIAGSPDGIRISRGVANKVSETVPPGRIHSVEISQPFLWRMGGWYRVRVNRIDARFSFASDSEQSAAAAMRTTPLPVGNLDDVQRLIALLLPMNVNPQVSHLIAEGLKAGRREGFHGVSNRSFWLHPFEWRRLGYAILPGLVMIRDGRLTRKLVLTPPERIQSVITGDSPIERMLGVAHVQCATIRGPAVSRIPGLAANEATRLFEYLSRFCVDAASRDTSHRWEESRAYMMMNAAQIEVEDAAKQGRAPAQHAVQVLAAQRDWQQRNAAARGGQSPAPRHPHPPQQPPRQQPPHQQQPPQGRAR
nr:PH domain-containing protein [Pseudoclavibacter sp. Marseille-Q3772]